MEEMVMIVAYVRRTRRAPVGLALRQLVQSGWSESEVIGHGHAAAGHGVEHVRFEVLLPAKLAKACTQAIARAAVTGVEGDGIIVTLPVATMERVHDIATN
jgi:nitrogen regulatory protein PII